MKIIAMKQVLLLSLALGSGAAFAEERFEYITLLDDPIDFVPTVKTLSVPKDGTAVTAEDTRKSKINFVLDALVRKVSDGDTVLLDGNNGAIFTIRMSDFDTPETSHKSRTDKDCACNSSPFREGQPGGRAATEALREILSIGDKVSAQCYEVDRYGRAVCHIFKDATNVNLEMIKNGWGRLPGNDNWIRDPNSKPAAEVAEMSKIGAWALDGQISPAQWRTDCWKSNMCDGAENWPYKKPN